MGDWVRLTAADGHTLQAYVAKPAAPAMGGVVLLQEIFGVNSHIRSLVEAYADAGFVAIAPALFDRVERGVELPYDASGTQKGLGLKEQLDAGTSLGDVAAALEYVAAAGIKVGVVGFCFGGLMSWLTATRGPSIGMQPACCVGYYAGGIGRVASEEPTCPVMLHFGADDTHIGQDQVGAVREGHPEVVIFEYEGAGHAFANDARSSYREDAAKMARERTLEFLTKYLA